MMTIVLIIEDEGVQLVAKVLEIIEVLGSMKKCMSMTMIVVVEERIYRKFLSSFAFCFSSFLSRERQRYR
jgi:hypothetical protein